MPPTQQFALPPPCSGYIKYRSEWAIVRLTHIFTAVHAQMRICRPLLPPRDVRLHLILKKKTKKKQKAIAVYWDCDCFSQCKFHSMITFNFSCFVVIHRFAFDWDILCCWWCGWWLVILCECTNYSSDFRLCNRPNSWHCICLLMPTNNNELCVHTTCARARGICQSYHSLIHRANACGSYGIAHSICCGADVNLKIWCYEGRWLMMPSLRYCATCTCLLAVPMRWEGEGNLDQSPNA